VIHENPGYPPNQGRLEISAQSQRKSQESAKNYRDQRLAHPLETGRKASLGAEACIGLIETQRTLRD
jgi:hypothetical protein